MKKRKMNYKYIILGIIVLIMLVIIIGLMLKDDKKSNENKEGNDKTKVFSSYYSIDLLENMEVDSYSSDLFEITQAVINNGTFEGFLFYTDEKTSAILNITVVIYDKDGNKLEKVDFELVDVRENEERDLYCFIDKDLSNAYYFEVEIN